MRSKEKKGGPGGPSFFYFFTKGPLPLQAAHFFGLQCPSFSALHFSQIQTDMCSPPTKQMIRPGQINGNRPACQLPAPGRSGVYGQLGSSQVLPFFC